MNYTALISGIVGALVAALPLLAYIASRTRNQVDDQVLAILQKFLSGIGADPAKATALTGIGTSPAAAAVKKEPLAPI